MRFEAKYIFIALVLVSIGLMGYQLGITAYAIHPQQNQANPVQTYLQEHYGVNSVDQLIQKYRQEYMSKYQNYLSQVPSEYLPEEFNTPQIEVSNSNGFNLYLLIQTLPILLGIPIGLTYKFSKRENVKKIVLIVGIAGMFFVIGYQVGYVHAQQGQIRIGSGSFTSETSYIIYGDDTNGDGVLDIIYAKNGQTGQIDFQGTDASTVIQDTIDVLNNGKILIKSGVYSVDVSGKSSDVLVLKSNVKLVCEHGVRFILSGTPSTIIKFIGIRGTSTEYIENVTVEGGEIDFTNTEMVTGITITYAKNIVVQGVKMYDKSNDPSKGTIKGIVIGTYNAGDNMGENVVIERCSTDFRGVRNSPPLRIYWFDRVTITNCDIKGRDPDVPGNASLGGAIQVQGTNYLKIINNYIRLTHHNAILFPEITATGYYSSNNTVIANNIFEDYENDAIDPNHDFNMVISGNVMKHGAYSTGWVSLEGDCENVAITGNVMLGAGHVDVCGSKKVSITGNLMIQTTRARNYITVFNGEDVTISGNTIYMTAQGVIIEGNSVNVVISGNYFGCAAYNDHPLHLTDNATRVIFENNIIEDLGGTWCRIAYIGSTSVTDVIIRNNMRGSLGRMRGPYLATGVDPVSQKIYADPSENYGLEQPSARRINSGVVYPCVNGTVVNHGLAGTPTRIILTLNGSRIFSDGTNTYILFQPTIIDLNPQNFTIELLCLNQTSGTVIAVTPSLYNATVYWRAEL